MLPSFGHRPRLSHLGQDGLTGSAWGDWASYTASPLRAFENELGVQARLRLAPKRLPWILNPWEDVGEKQTGYSFAWERVA